MGGDEKGYVRLSICRTLNSIFREDPQACPDNSSKVGEQGLSSEDIQTPEKFAGQGYPFWNIHLINEIVEPDSQSQTPPSGPLQYTNISQHPDPSTATQCSINSRVRRAL
jgi:hypothetical protein